MQAITFQPDTPGSARFENNPEPEFRLDAGDPLLSKAMAVGICG